MFIGDRLLVIRRDDRPDIPWPGHWDLPGGGREGAESPEACVLRETREEVGLALQPAHLIRVQRHLRPHGWVWFFAAHLPARIESDIVFGSEGQGWALMPPEDYCAHPLAVPHFAQWLRRYLASPGA